EAAAALARGARVSRMVPAVMRELHVSRRPFDEAAAPRAWTNFLESLDPQHVYFTAEDLAAFEPARHGYPAMLATGDLEFPKRVFDTFVSRVERYAGFVAAAVSNEFDFAEEESFRWRRRNAPWPADDAELEDLWTKRVKNAILASRVSRVVREEEKAEKAKEPPESPDSPESPEPPDSPESADPPASPDDKVREDILRANAAFIDILHDSDEQFWLEKWFDAVATSYDPHSNYMSPTTSEDFAIDMQLSLQGIGAQLRTDDGAAKIVEIIPGSPAERDVSPEHLVPGDKIIGVAQEGDEDFTDIRHWPLYKAVRLIRGPKGSTVRLKVIPVSDPDGSKIVTLVRDEIKLEEQAAFSRVEKVTDESGAERTVGYLRIPAFYASTVGSGAGASQRRVSLDAAEELASLNEAGVESLVLDLRGNGGGSLPEAVYVAGLFLRTGPVVIVKERHRAAVLPDNDPAVAFRRPVVVMVDRLSASASEIVAAALQDYGRAVVVGDKTTHGKGTVQTILPLENGNLGSLKATTALFYRVDGSSTQIRGVSSDIVLPSLFSTFPELGEDKLPGALAWTRIAPSSYRPVDDLLDAKETLRERSEARLATNAAWQARSRLLDRFAQFNAEETVSLNWDARLERAREDARLNREIAALGGSGDEGAASLADETASESEEEEDAAAARRRKRNSKERDPADLVLAEALQIAVDLADVHGEPASFDPPVSDFDFLRSFFR
ncbi:MAG: carboxy terminal-processing peptidase, partial [Kiritimatiellae bacterium]|nr:carboxy terminal-processing peptidase [Kiritimatiellia bacterium]